MARVLVVDDDADVRRILGAVLEPVAEVALARDGEEALRLLRDVKPAVILLDMAMPGADGMEVLARARASQPGVAVVMLTGERDIDLARAALDAGARSYITKPFDPDAVRAEVVRLTGGDRDDGSDGRPWRVAS